MNIDLTSLDMPILSHNSFINALNKHYINSMKIENEHIKFDLTYLERFELFEIALLVTWISKCLKRQKSVSLLFPNCYSLTSPYNIFRISNIEKQYHYEEVLNYIGQNDGPSAQREIEAKVERLENRVRDDVKAKKIPNYVYKQLNTLRKEMISKFERSDFLINALINSLSRQFLGMRVIGFASRLGIIDTLQNFGCTIQPSNWHLLAWPYAYAPDVTGTMPFKRITTETDLVATYMALSEKNELQRIFGEYSHMDFIRGGALSNVILFELGSNIIEHSKTHRGFITTRVIHFSSLGHFSLPVIKGETPHFFSSLKTASNGFLEVVVCDDGIGIPESLRETLRQVYHNFHDTGYQLNPDIDEDVIDFSFDRLGSSKKTASELLGQPYSKDDKLPLFKSKKDSIASGLFWIWNLVRTYHGFLLVRSGKVEIGYDFSVVDESGLPSKHVSSVPMVGTHLWICLPLGHKDERIPVQRGRQILMEAENEEDEKRSFFFYWIGDLSCRIPVSQLEYQANEDALREIYDEIKKGFELLNKKDSVLVFDLTSVHQEWFHRNAQYLVGAILELNYLAPTGIHAAILFNAPYDRREVLMPEFHRHCSSLLEAQPDLAKLRLATVVFWDDRKTVDFISPREEVSAILSSFGDSPTDLSVDEIYKSVSPKLKESHIFLQKDEIIRILVENGHIIGEIQRYGDERRFRLILYSELLREKAQECFLNEITQLAETENLQDKMTDKNTCAFVRRLEEGEGAFWLPSSGLFAKEFFQVGVLASNSMWRARIGWLLAEEVMYSTERKNPIQYLITITRSTPLFLTEAQRFLEVIGVSPKIILADDLRTLKERLTKEMNNLSEDVIRPNVLIFTDVISTGRLISKTWKQITDIGFHVVSIFAVADIRSEESSVDHRRLGNRVKVLFHKQVPKIAFFEGRRIDIDELEVCPVGTVPETLWKPTSHHKKNKGMWIMGTRELIDKGVESHALITGHLRRGDYHHYIYYLRGERILASLLPFIDKTVQSKIISIIKKDLGSSMPDNIVVLHPNHQNAEWQTWVKLVCEQTGALWRHIIYRDLVGRRWHFSAFVDHGVPLKGKDVIILDDGTCTGDTITALIETCAIGGAKKIFAYFFIDRMPLIKSDLMARMKKIQSETELSPSKSLAIIKIRALGGLQIPVYMTDSCPICDQRDEADKIVSRYVSVGKIARIFSDQLISHDISNIGVSLEESSFMTKFPWYIPSDLALVWKIRQALEYFPYDEPSVNGEPESSFELLENAYTKEEGALAFSFIVCTEPSITMNKWFRKRAEDILMRWISYLDTNISNKKEIATLITAIFRVSESGNVENNFPAGRLVKLVVDKLSNDYLGRYAAEQLLFLIACGFICEKGSYRQMHATDWMTSLYNEAQDSWVQFPLKHTKYIIKQTMFLGRTLGGLYPSDSEKTIYTLHDNLRNLVTFIGLHSTDDEVDFKLKTHIAKLGKKIDLETLTECINFLESFENRIDSFFTCSDILSRIRPKRADISHPLIAASTHWTHELSQVADMHGEILDGIGSMSDLLSASEETFAEQLQISGKIFIDLMKSILKKWLACKNDIQNFLKEVVINVHTEANNCIKHWLQSHPNKYPTRISPYKGNNEFIGLMPRSLLRAFILICLDNAKNANAKEKDEKPIVVGLSKEEGEIKLSVVDEGIPFDPSDDISNKPLGVIARDLKHFKISLQMPMKNETPKAFTLRIPSSDLDIRINHKEDYNAAS